MKKLRRYKAIEVEIKNEGNDKYRFEQKEIILDERPMFMMMFRGLNINPDEVESIDWIIKVKFDSQEDALKCRKYPIVLDDKTYHFYLSTPSDMKNNKAIYVREDVFSLVKQYEDIVSCGCINLLEG